MSGEVSDSQKWQNLKVIHLAMMAGATLFLGVCGVVIYNSLGKESAQVGSLMTFALMVGATWVVSQMLKMQIEVLFQRKLAGENPFPAYQSLVMIRMALSEGPALFGLVGLFLFGPGSGAAEMPRLLVFLLPYLSLIFTGLKYMPSERDFKDRIRVAKESKGLRRK
ncbi:hypothetical protein P0Y35_10460 [Kiritimatiellaeota bacterium B1221]|nr:hypothetical protein [Kiritimatiellaeota bacterium B1221]